MSAWQQGSSLEHSTYPQGDDTAALLERLGHVDPAAEDWEQQLSAVTSGIVDLLLQADVDGLSHTTDPLRDALAGNFAQAAHAREFRGWILALLSVTRWGVQRLPSVQELEFAQGGMTVNFLRALETGVPRSSSDLRTRLGTGPTQVSRIGRELLARGLVVQRRLGRQAVWELTPRGRQLVREHSRNGPAAMVHQPALSGHTAIGSNGRARTHRSTRAGTHHRTGKQPVRHVLPADGGWRIAKGPDARTIEQTASKQQAVERASEILKRSGGGSICVHNRSGESIRKIDIDPH
jgi:DNA-binding MarR family transcriptional regulator